MKMMKQLGQHHPSCHHTRALTSCSDDSTGDTSKRRARPTSFDEGVKNRVLISHNIR